jgi:hypothetical protein
MATVLREVLNADQMNLTVFCGGQSKVGIGVTGTFVGTLSFAGSFDGINFVPLTVTPFASGTGVQTATATGNWEVNVKNLVAVRVTFSRTSGSATVFLGTSIDSSYQTAFLAATSVNVTQEVSAGATNVITQAAQANRAWRLRTLSVAFSVAAGAAVKVTVADGANNLWSGFVPKQDVSTGGFTWQAPLPADTNTPGVSGGGVVGTPGNAMTVTLAAPGGSVVSEVNCEFIPA